jgi:NosR/NirI family transcriptional regulator, nitrous oxide reductase regulator
MSEIKSSNNSGRKPGFRGRFFSGLVTAILVLAIGSSYAARGPNYTRLANLERVMPEADRFSEKEGEPPVIRAYKNDELIGYVYLTNDVPPLANGYSGPINVLIGLGLDGYIKGLRVVSYRESHRLNLGDFLAVPGFQEQFIGKHATDNFRVYYDVDGMARATITVKAMAKGIRHSIRRVAQTYLR